MEKKCSFTYIMYETIFDAFNDYKCIGNSTVVKCLNKFVNDIIDVFESDEYL